MTAALQLLLLAASVTYIVDVSGFTESWRALLARVLHVRPDQLRALPPFDCGKCATFWAVLLWGLLRCGLPLLPALAYACAASLLSQSFCAAMIFISEAINKIFDKITPDR